LPGFGAAHPGDARAGSHITPFLSLAVGYESSTYTVTRDMRYYLKNPT